MYKFCPDGTSCSFMWLVGQQLTKSKLYVKIIPKDATITLYINKRPIFISYPELRKLRKLPDNQPIKFKQLWTDMYDLKYICPRNPIECTIQSDKPLMDAYVEITKRHLLFKKKFKQLSIVRRLTPYVPINDSMDVYVVSKGRLWYLKFFYQETWKEHVDQLLHEKPNKIFFYECINLPLC